MERALGARVGVGRWGRVRHPPSAPNMRRNQQALDDTPVLEMGFDNFIDIVRVNEGVPGRLRVDHRDRPGGAAVQAPSLVDPDLPGA